jgi:hypothetical protein
MAKYSDGTNRTTSFGVSRSETYDPTVIRGTCVRLLWNLEDLADCLREARDLTADDRDGYLERAGRIFDGALGRVGGRHAEDS